MSLVVQQIAAQLVELGICTAEDVEAAGQAGADATAQTFVQTLVRRGCLTGFQGELVLQDKARSMLLGEYVVIERIGSGGMGKVYRARHRRMRREVAIKTLPRRTEDENALRRFYREVEAAAKLIHPNIVTAYDAGEHRGVHYLVMEYVEGVDLSALVRTQGALPLEQAVNAVIQAGSGLAYAHANGVVHRDIKPANLLLNRQGLVKILDMGLARMTGQEAAPAESQEITAAGRLMGTAEYMAPEQAANARNADHRADIYSLGCTFYRLATGQLPYPAPSALEMVFAHRQNPIPALHEVLENTPIGLQQIFEAMLAKSPEERYQSMEMAVADMKAIVPTATSCPPQIVGPVKPSAAGGGAAASPSSSGAGSKSSASNVSSPSKSAHRGSPSAIPVAGPASASPSASGAAAAERTSGSRPPAAPQPGNRTILWIAGGAAAALVAIIAGVGLRSMMDSTPSPTRPPTSAPPASKMAATPPAAPAPKPEPKTPAPAEIKSADIDERRLAGRALDFGAKSVVIKPAVGLDVEIKDSARLPSGGLKIISIDFSNSGSRVTDSLLAEFAGLRAIQSLNLNGTSITGIALKSIGRMQTLQTLNVSNTKIDAESFADLKPLIRLRELRMGGLGSLDDRILKTLAGFHDLQQLHVERAGVTDAAAPVLARLSSLEHLDIRRTQLTGPAIDQIQNRLPRCEIRSGYTGKNANPRPDGEGFHTLFDGANLGDWVGGDRSLIKLEYDAVVARSKAGHLFYAGEAAGGDFTNFHLKLQILADPQGNGGVVFHTQPRDKGTLPGIEVQVNHAGADESRSGGLWSIADVGQSPVTRKEWYTQEIIVEGRRVRSIINGRTVVDVTLDDAQAEKLSHGTIGLQFWDKEVAYRQVKIKPLP